MTAGIYWINNMINDDCYIGQSTNIEKRLRHHYSRLQCGKHESRLLQEAINQFGLENFTFEVLEIIENPTEAILIEFEAKWHNRIKPKYSFTGNSSERTKQGLKLSRDRGMKFGAARDGHNGLSKEAIKLGQVASIKARKEKAWNFCKDIQYDIKKYREQRKTYEEIANILNLSGIKTRTGKKWNHNSVRNVNLFNPNLTKLSKSK